MNAVTLQVLLWYYVGRPGDYITSVDDCESTRDGVVFLLGQEMLKENPHPEKAEFSVTERGRVYVEALLKTRFPTQKWIVPAATGK